MHGIPAYLERSRSGKGGHVWIFFEHAIAALLARQLGCAILTQTMEQRHHVGLDSYDRFFPNQDTMPKGGFGNLIALPLQWMPRQNVPVPASKRAGKPVRLWPQVMAPTGSPALLSVADSPLEASRSPEEPREVQPGYLADFAEQMASPGPVQNTAPGSVCFIILALGFVIPPSVRSVFALALLARDTVGRGTSADT